MNDIWTRCWRARRTINEMFRDRGLRVVEPTAAVAVSPEALAADCARMDDRNLLQRLAVHGRDAKSDVLVLCYLCANSRGGKVGVSEVREMSRSAVRAGAAHLIIVYVKQLTPFARKSLKSLDIPSVESFSLDSLQFNVTRHRYVPTHTLLSSTESAAVLAENAWEADALPIILTTGDDADPVARYLNAKPGDILRVVKPSPEGTTVTTYRLAV